jgi:pilus assembly protein CpaC
VSALDTSHAVTIAGVSVPALTVQRAETTVELGSGQSFAIAGLLDKSMSQTGTGIPGLSSIPVLGALFDTTNFQRSSEELVIIVTPYLVRPVQSPADLRTPTGGFVPATSLEQILFGHQLPTGTFQGTPFDPGFSME